MLNCIQSFKSEHLEVKLPLYTVLHTGILVLCYVVNNQRTKS